MKSIKSFLLLPLLLLLTCCSQQPEQPVITFAYQDRVADAASIIAVQQGYFSQEGLTVKGLLFSSGPACTEALTYGNANFGTMGDTTAIITASHGNAFTILASHAGGEQRHRLMVARDSSISSLAELQGRRIGIKKGTSSHGGFELLASKHGLDFSEELIDMSPADQLLALASGELDAMVASEPSPSKAEADCFGRELTNLCSLGNSYPIFLLVNSKFAQQHPQVAAKMLRALSRASTFINEQPEQAATILARQSGLPLPVVRQAMSYHRYRPNLDEATLASLAVSASFLQRIGKIQAIPNWQQAINSQPLQQALAGEQR